MDIVETFADQEMLMQAAAGAFTRLARKAVEARGRFTAALAGGSTPAGLYRRLAQGEGVDWARVHVFWGDERCVPPSHPKSNYRMARETLLDAVRIPDGNVHRVRGETKPVQAADEYERTLRAFFEPESESESEKGPRFDLILLGMGEDGHTASLFPGTAPIHERARWVCPIQCRPGLDVPRVTLTPVVLNAAADVIFLVAGAHKAQTFRRVMDGPYQPDTLPAQIVNPAEGRLRWMVDAAVVSGLLSEENPE